MMNWNDVPPIVIFTFSFLFFCLFWYGVMSLIQWRESRPPKWPSENYKPRPSFVEFKMNEADKGDAVYGSYTSVSHEHSVYAGDNDAFKADHEKNLNNTKPYIEAIYPGYIPSYADPITYPGTWNAKTRQFETRILTGFSLRKVKEQTNV